MHSLLDDITSLEDFSDIKNQVYDELQRTFRKRFEDSSYSNFDLFLRDNQVEVIKESGLFDEKEYIKQCPDVDVLDWDVVTHYVNLGENQGCTPNDFFDPNWYFRIYPKIKEAGLNAFFHYLTHGIKEGRVISEEDKLLQQIESNELTLKGMELIKEYGLFDKDYYLLTNSDVKRENTNALYHYLVMGYNENRNPSAEFNSKFYLDTYEDARESGLNPLVHYVLYGMEDERETVPEEKIKPHLPVDIKDESDEIKELIYKYGLFDEDYYVKQCTDFEEYNLSPLDHYLKVGYKQGLNPSALFNNSYYLNKYADVRNNRLNPLVHYVNSGIKENRSINRVSEFNVNFNKLDVDAVNNICDNFEATTSIIIPIYNALEETKACITSVIEHTNLDYELILVNDCSTDPDMKPYLEEVARIYDNVVLINNEVNLGFVGSVNKGMKYSKNDVILLNSDTEVTPRWLEKLRINAYSDDKIATVTPLSNSAGVFSVPESNKKNKIPNYLSLGGMSKLIESASLHINMQVPTGNGFCLFIKRAVLDDVGYFDEEHFGKGYGEENDFCMRAIYAGWTHIIDDSTYIYHKESASFSDSKLERIRKNMKVLNRIHPSYNQLVKEFVNSDDLKLIRSKISKELKRVDSEINKKRILYVIHEQVENFCGTGDTNVDLTNNLNESVCYVLSSTAEKLILYKKYGGEYVSIKEWTLHWEPSEFYNEKFRAVYFNIIYALNIDVIHIDHLVKQTFDLPRLADMLGIPVLLLLHDFYLMCPSINLLDDDNVYCAGNCSLEHKCTGVGFFKNFPDYKEIIDNWRKETTEVFSHCSYVVAPTEMVLNKFKEKFPILETKQTKAILHGREFDDIVCNYTKPEDYIKQNRPVKILCPGRLLPTKGAYYIREIKKYDKDNRIEFHFLGKITPILKDAGIFHGEYEREDFKRLTSNISPSFIGLFSIWPETYCHTLTEAWDCGIPVIATNLGALKERIDNTGCGKLVDYTSPKDAYEKIIELIDNPDEYQTLKDNIDNLDLKTAKQMGQEYNDIYVNLINYNKPLAKSSLNLKEMISNHRSIKKSFSQFLIESIRNPLMQYPLDNDKRRYLAMMNSLGISLRNYVPEEKPLVSIILPVYNRQRVVSQAINSVLDQTYENFELIVVDDGSSDGSVNVVESFEDSRIKLICNEINKGVSKTRNIGLENAQGEYIAYLDSDNTWEPEYLETMVASFYRIPDADAIYCAQNLYHRFSDRFPFGIRFGSMNKSLLNNSNNIDMNCFCHKREVYDELGGFDENLRRFVDWDLILKINSKYSIYSIPVILSNYYLNNVNNRISDVEDEDESYSEIKNKIALYNVQSLEDKITNNKPITILIPNAETKNNIKNCLDALFSQNLSQIHEIRIIYNGNMDAFNYIHELNKSCITLVKYDNSLSLTENIFNQFNEIDNNCDVVLLNSLAILNNSTLASLQYYSQHLDNSGIVVPQQIILSLEEKDDLITRHMPYSSDKIDCDVALSRYNSSIINVPIFSSGEYYELDTASFFCMYLKEEVINQFKINPIEDMYDYYEFAQLLSEYVRYILDYKIYYVYESKAFYNIRGRKL